MITTTMEPSKTISTTFKSLLMNKGQDPSVVCHDGYYYMVQSEGGHITMRQSETIGGLCDAETVIIFTPPDNELYSADMWAPDLVYLRDNWYIYFTANDTPGNNDMHRMFVLQADSTDPMGSWSFKGKVYTHAETDKWAIDGVAFDYNDKLYMVWSGWPTDKGDFPQNLYIAEMSDPTTITGQRVQISAPDQCWERSVAPIQEAPTPFIHNGQLSIVYSTDASWSPAYKLALLKLNGSDPLNPDAWIKVGPVFEQAPEAGIYGPGHNSLPVCSPNSNENWLFFHAKAKSRKGWGDRRIHVQPFTWNEDNTPHFGTPVAAHTVFDLASNAADEALRSYDIPVVMEQYPYENIITVDSVDDEEITDAGDMLLSTLLGSYSMSAWIKLDRADGVFTIAKQKSKLGSAFTLYYDSFNDKFGFSMNNGKGDNIASVLSNFSPREGEWYHVVGVCDMLKDELVLYINGVQESSAPCSSNWEVSAQAILDTDDFAGAAGANVSAMLNVQFYDNALGRNQVTALFSGYVQNYLQNHAISVN